MNQSLSSLSVAQLRRAIEIRERMEALEKELAAIQGASTVAAPAPSARKRTMSPAARAKIAAAQKARWAQRKGKKGAAPVLKVVAAAESKPRRKLTPAGRRRLAALAKARWAKARAAGKTSLKG